MKEHAQELKTAARRGPRAAEAVVTKAVSSEPGKPPDPALGVGQEAAE